MSRKQAALAPETHDDAPAGDFDSYLEKSAETIRPPERSPTGRWVLRNVGTFLRKTKREDLENNPDLPLGRVEFIFTPHEPLEGVDPDLVEEGKWRGKRITVRRNIKDPGDDYKVLNLAAMHGIDLSGRNLKQVIEACKGRFVEGTVGVYSYTRKDTGEEVVENNIQNFAPVNG